MALRNNAPRLLRDRRWRPRIILVLSVLGLNVAVLAIVWPSIDHFMVTGRFSPITKIDSLNNPIGVNGWTADGLLLADGRTLPIPQVRALPSNSVALAEIAKRGVEVRNNGGVYALVQVHHWCGNDPVRTHIARVNVADMLTYLRVGETIGPMPEEQFRATETGGRFSQWGWRVGEFYQFEMWQKLKDSAR